MKKMFVGCVAMALPCLIAADTQAQKWADVTLTVVLEGKAPSSKLTNANAKDPQCNTLEKGVPSEDLVVNATNNGIANLVFTIDTKKTTIAEKDIHPDLRAVPKTKPILDNLKCQFIPHIMAVRAGQSIEVKNSDSTAHNAKFAFFANEEKNPTIPAMSSVDIPTKLEEKAPTKVECNIHPWMSAYVMVFNHPYVGISDGDGKIKIEKLPAGVPLDFKIWHENQDKSIEEVTINGKKEKWVKGSAKMTLKEGVNDLGKVVINIDRFKK
jgi:plastocyanin